MGRQAQLRTFLALCLLAAFVQAVAFFQTRLPARDNVEFLRIAHSFSAKGVAATVRASIHHPFYPAVIAGVHEVAHTRGFAESARLWLACGQIAAALPLVVLPIFVYLAGLRLFPHRVAQTGAAFLCILPACCLLGTDGLTESWYLLFFFIGLWCSLEFLAARRVGWLFGSGVACGFAYLARPEGLVLPVAMLTTLAILQIIPSWRLEGRRWATATVALVLGLLIVASPYAIMMGQVTGKHSLDRILGRRCDPPTPEYVSAQHHPLPPIAAEPSISLDSPGSPRRDDHQVGWRGAMDEARLPGFESLSFRAPPPYEQLQGYREALEEFGQKFLESLRFLLAALALVAAFFPLVPRPRPCDVLVVAVLAIFSAAVILSAAHDGFIAARHLLTIFSIVIFWSAHGAWLAIDWLSPRMAHSVNAFRSRGRSTRPATSASQPAATDVRLARGLVGGALFSAVAAVCFFQIGVPRREEQTGHLAAAQWIEANTAEDDVMLDTYGWASLLANRESYQYRSAREAFLDPRLRWVVVEAKELEEQNDRSLTLRTLLELGGSLRGLFVGSDGDPEHTVNVYEWSPALASRRLNRIASAGGDQRATAANLERDERRR